MLEAHENLTEHRASRVKAEHFLHEDGKRIPISFFHDDPLIVASEAELRGVASPKLAQLLAIARSQSRENEHAIEALPRGDLAPKLARFAHCDEKKG